MAIVYRIAEMTDTEALLPMVEAYALEQQAEVPINTLRSNYMELVQTGIAQAIEHPAGCVMLAEETEGPAPRLVGYAVGMLQEPPPIFESQIYTFLSDLYVDPAFRRRGIGTGLVERVRGWGWMKGITRLSLVVPTNSAAEGLYRKLGFKPVQTMLYYKDEV